MYPLYPMYPSYPFAQNKLWGEYRVKSKEYRVQSKDESGKMKCVFAIGPLSQAIIGSCTADLVTLAQSRHDGWSPPWLPYRSA